jgi:AraC family ethanolamine operon transcriptional activator
VGPWQSFALVSDRPFELATRGAFDIVAVGIGRAALERHAGRADAAAVADAAPALACNGVLGGPAGADDGLRNLLLEALAAARTAPQHLQADAARAALQDALCEALLVRLRASAAPGGATQAGCATAATRQRVVREARQYMRTHADAPIGVPDLCAALHVSRRTLQYSFQDVLQMSPVAYLRALRLNGVRRDLQAAGDAPVGDVAARWGFWHLSRFAADYRRLFGERPSDTRRQARDAVH